MKEASEAEESENQEDDGEDVSFGDAEDERSGEDDDQGGSDGGGDDGVREKEEVKETEGTPEVGSKRQIPTTRRSTRKRQKGL